MGFSQEIHVKQGYLLVVAYGEFSLREAEVKYLQMCESVMQNKQGKVLLDGRQVVGNLDAMARFYYGEFVAANWIRMAARDRSVHQQFAYVLSYPVLDPDRLGETAAVNRGLYVKAFDNIDEAAKWLGIMLADTKASG